MVLGCPALAGDSLIGTSLPTPGRPVAALVSACLSLLRPASLRGLELDGGQDIVWGS